MSTPEDQWARWSEWAEQGEALFAAQLARLDDAEFDAPSLLPGWSRRHVIAHVAYNARALTRLVAWARTGEERRMYPDTAARDREIDAGARSSPAELRALVLDSRRGLREALVSLPRERRSAQVVTAQGRAIPATEILWLRTREVWVHTVDLDVGVGFTQFPDELLDALLTDITAVRESRGQEPALVLTPGDRTRCWKATAGSSRPFVLTGAMAELVAALTGRGRTGVACAGGALPELGRWL
ncbi:maleylpyruvate isomerase family mycothiol-dependent enzyme [Actinomadura sp. NPDC049753]|uniref:maleylpyruvate isomerase family mycothiol-dependent enzyme n=1 Tax=Actinomadura sp. NPDC049753 TaxID=3154739 RepID=UPI0034445AF4